ncbi:MAG TPA: AMP-binding protein [Stellaceae bacterium]|nr:AMP-binding protein [Stellaceae bacterium]
MVIQAGPFYDSLETRDLETREHDLLTSLAKQIAHAKAHAPAFTASLRDVDPASITSRTALARLPVVRKSELIERQKQSPPFGGLAAVEPGALARVFMSPGPIYDPEGKGRDYWRMARSLFAAGFRAGDLIHNCFAYHLTPAGSMLETGAQALGCAVIPGGTGQTELQIKAIEHLHPQGYVGTPSFLRIILEKGRELGADLSSIKKALVGGEAFPPALQKEIAGFSVAALQCYASADLGLIAYESPARAGLIVDEGILLEIVRPGTGDPVADGEVGEVVVTTLTPDYPLIRFATGDLSAILKGPSPCGRTNLRIKGWMGRADQTTKVKGMFVHPSQVAEAVRPFHEVLRARLVVSQEHQIDLMTLLAEVPAGTDPAIAERLAESLHAITKLKGKVALQAPGTLPNDGKVIEDTRKLV